MLSNCLWALANKSTSAGNTSRKKRKAHNDGSGIDSQKRGFELFMQKKLNLKQQIQLRVKQILVSLHGGFDQVMLSLPPKHQGPFEAAQSW